MHGKKLMITENHILKGHLRNAQSSLNQALDVLSNDAVDTTIQLEKPENKDDVEKILTGFGLNTESMSVDDLIKIYIAKKAQKDSEPEVIYRESQIDDAMAYIQRYNDLRKHLQGKGWTESQKTKWAVNHYDKFGRSEGRQWGIMELINPPATSRPSIDSANGILWKPVAESRGGVPALLTANRPQYDIVLMNVSELPINVRRLEKRGLTNGGRETYFFHGVKARELPKPTLIKISDSEVYVIPDPTLRYD